MHAVNFARISQYINGPLKNAILALAESNKDKAAQAVQKKLVVCTNREHAEPFYKKDSKHYEGVTTHQALLLDIHRNVAQLLDYDTVTVNAKEYYANKSLQ